MVHFPISGVDTYWWLPLLVAFLISCCTSLGGVSGAFLLLPFQMSVLGFTGPAVSPTNLMFNLVAIPSGVYSYYREGRMVWPLVWVIITGTVPGVFLGVVIRIRYLPDPTTFKLFAGIVLLYIGLRICLDIVKSRKASSNGRLQGRPLMVSETSLDAKYVRFEFNGASHQATSMAVLGLSFAVGMIGGAYGIGGGAIIAPLLVVAFRLPVYTVSGAALAATFVTSIVGIVFYSILSQFYSAPNLSIAPDWALGALLGAGGAAGMYVGARLQKHVPAKLIKTILAACIIPTAALYIVGFFR